MAINFEGSLQSIIYERNHFKVLDQLKVPHELVYREIRSVEDGVDAIKTMQVRGAPLIAVVGCLSIAAELQEKEFESNDLFVKWIEEKVKDLVDARPTAVNMKREGQALIKFVKDGNDKEKVLEYIEDLVRIDQETNKKIGDFGAEEISEGEKVNVLTHCNTGSLATSGYGTALGVIRSLHTMGRLEHAYFTETRPYNQGSRLTAFELLHDQIPSTLVCDSAVSWLMKTKGIVAVVVGADRVARNGDTANKVGTYQLALAAKAHNAKFYVAAPFSTIDGEIGSGDEIVIEERGSEEVTHIKGQAISPEGVQVWNPAFDVTPANLITGIITEKGVFAPDQLAAQLQD